jgi:NCS1 family nucleobase:cation symporter-1
MVAIAVATLTTNIAANIVAPANSFANLSPERITFRLGGLAAGVLGILIVPWKLLDVYQAWLITYSGLLGAIAGVLICDYLVIRRSRLSVHDLYVADGIYRYTNGVNRPALAALAAGILFALAGLIDPRLRFLFDGSWFTAAGTSFVVYLALMRGRNSKVKSENLKGQSTFDF